jgi:gliding motility-associated-like protein
MKIEELFKNRLKDAKVKAPNDLWSKIDSGLNNIPQANSISPNTISTISGSFKAIAVSCGVAIASVTAYIVYDQVSEKQDNTIIAQETQTELPVEGKQKQVETIEQITPTKTETKQIVLQETITKVTPITPEEETIINEIYTPKENTNNTITNTPTNTPPVVTKEEIKQEKAPQETIEEIQEPINQTEEIIKEDIVFDPDIKIPNFISPNNDGINDYFNIHNIESYPDNELIILDSRKRKVYQARSYNNEWGASNIPQGTYFYKLLIKEGQNQKILHGVITIQL